MVIQSSTLFSPGERSNNAQSSPLSPHTFWEYGKEERLSPRPFSSSEPRALTPGTSARAGDDARPAPGVGGRWYTQGVEGGYIPGMVYTRHGREATYPGRYTPPWYPGSITGIPTMVPG